MDKRKRETSEAADAGEGSRSEDRIARALERTAVTLFGQDADLRYEWVFNPRLGFTAQEVLGRTDEELLPPQTAARLAEAKRAALESKTPRRVTVRIGRHDGERAGVFDLHIVPEIDEAGRATGITGAAVKVDEVHPEADESALADRHLRDGIESLMDPVGIYSAVRDETGRIVDFRIEYVNAAACRANMMSREEQVGHLLCELLPGHRDSGLFDAYCRLVETGEPVSRQDEIYEDEYGGQRLVRAFDICATKHEDGFVASWRDVTERRKQELALAASLRESDLLRRELEHRVGNNLQILASLMAQAARHAKPDAALALTAARRQVLLVGALYGKLRARPGEPDAIALDTYLPDICETMRSGLDLDRRGVALDVAAAPVLVGPREAIILGLVVNELVTNAAVHAFEGRERGRIAVGLARDDGRVCLTVADDGIGLGPPDAASGGSGRRLVAQLATTLPGELSCDSRAGGTTYRLAFREPARGP